MLEKSAPWRGQPPSTLGVPHGQCFAERDTCHRKPFRTRTAPTLAGSYGLCFPDLGSFRGFGHRARVREISCRSNQFQPCLDCNWFHTHVWVVWSEFVLASVAQGLMGRTTKDTK